MFLLIKKSKELIFSIYQETYTTKYRVVCFFFVLLSISLLYIITMPLSNYIKVSLNPDIPVFWLFFGVLFSSFSVIYCIIPLGGIFGFPLSLIAPIYSSKLFLKVFYIYWSTRTAFVDTILSDTFLIFSHIYSYSDYISASLRWFTWKNHVSMTHCYEVLTKTPFESMAQYYAYLTEHSCPVIEPIKVVVLNPVEGIVAFVVFSMIACWIMLVSGASLWVCANLSEEAESFKKLLSERNTQELYLPNFYEMILEIFKHLNL